MPTRLLSLLFFLLALVSLALSMPVRAQGPVDVAAVVDEIITRGDAAVAAHTPATRLETGSELSACISRYSRRGAWNWNWASRTTP